jgi:hypothetical protein
MSGRESGGAGPAVRARRALGATLRHLRPPATELALVPSGCAARAAGPVRIASDIGGPSPRPLLSGATLPAAAVR